MADTSLGPEINVVGASLGALDRAVVTAKAMLHKNDPGASWVSSVCPSVFPQGATEGATCDNSRAQCVA